MISEKNIQENDHFSFDLWKTLISSNKEYKTKRVSLFKSFFSINYSDEKIAQAMRKIDINCNSINEQTGLHLTFDQIVCFFLLEFNIKINQISKQLIEELYQKNEIIFLENMPEMIINKDIFENIKTKNKSISLISNTGFVKGETVRKFLDRIDILKYFDFLLFSDEEGFSKPNIKIFEKSYEKIINISNVSKDRVLHVGDNKIADYNGAISFGYNALLV